MSDPTPHTKLIRDIFPRDHVEYRIDLARLWLEIDEFSTPRSDTNFSVLMHDRYHPDGSVKWAYSSIGTIHGMTRSRVHQLIKWFCQQLRHPGRIARFAKRIDDET